MQYKSVKGYTGIGQIGFLFLFTGIGLVIAAVAQFMIGFSLLPAGTPLDKAPEQMVKAMGDVKNVNTLRILQVVSTLLMMGLPTYFFMRICHSNHWLWLGFSKHIKPVQVLLGIILMFCVTMVAQPLADFTKYILSALPGWIQKADALEKLYNEQVVLMSNLTGWGELIIAIVIIAFFPALFEEMFFRGALQNTLQRWWKNPWAAILVTSVLFSLIHFSIYLFLSRALLGFALGWLFYKSRNIWVGVLIHFFNNTFALSQVFYLKRTEGKIDISKLDTDLPWWGIAISAVVLIAAVVLFQRVSVKPADNIHIQEELLFAKEQPFGNITQSFNQNLYS